MYASPPRRRTFFYATRHKKGVTFVTPFLSGYQDSNLGLPAPKAGALTGLRYIPNHYVKLLSLLSDSNQRPRDYKSRALAN